VLTRKKSIDDAAHRVGEITAVSELKIKFFFLKSGFMEKP
jgi:hypothetical protein